MLRFFFMTADGVVSPAEIGNVLWTGHVPPVENRWSRICDLRGCGVVVVETEPVGVGGERLAAERRHGEVLLVKFIVIEIRLRHRTVRIGEAENVYSDVDVNAWWRNKLMTIWRWFHRAITFSNETQKRWCIFWPILYELYEWYIYTIYVIHYRHY